LHLWKTILLRGQGRSRQMKKKERMGRGRRERGRFHKQRIIVVKGVHL
jgi:hypothetical protein